MKFLIFLGIIVILILIVVPILLWKLPKKDKKESFKSKDTTKRITLGNGQSFIQ